MHYSLLHLKQLLWLTLEFISPRAPTTFKRKCQRKLPKSICITLIYHRQIYILNTKCYNTNINNNNNNNLERRFLKISQMNCVAMCRFICTVKCSHCPFLPRRLKDFSRVWLVTLRANSVVQREFSFPL